MLFFGFLGSFWVLFGFFLGLFRGYFSALSQSPVFTDISCYSVHIIRSDTESLFTSNCLFLLFLPYLLLISAFLSYSNYPFLYFLVIKGYSGLFRGYFCPSLSLSFLLHVLTLCTFYCANNVLISSNSFLIL